MICLFVFLIKFWIPYRYITDEHSWWTQANNPHGGLTLAQTNNPRMAISGSNCLEFSNKFLEIRNFLADSCLLINRKVQRYLIKIPYRIVKSRTFNRHTLTLFFIHFSWQSNLCLSVKPAWYDWAAIPAFLKWFATLSVSFLKKYKQSTQFLFEQCYWVLEITENKRTLKRHSMDS